jgi:hypothetical protein
MSIEQELPSYVAVEHGNRVPTMAVNVLSKSTWAVDLSDHVDKSRLLGIPLYVVFPAYHVATATYKPPFLRAYIYQASTRQYGIHDLNQAIVKEGEALTHGLCEDSEKLLDTSSIVPFRIGLMERRVKVRGGLSAWRMILVHPTEPRILLTCAEQEKARADAFEKLVAQYKGRFGSLD